MKFNLKKPCANCPFKKEGGIDLRPGRVEGIIAGLLADDYSVFYCHKTTRGEYRDDDEDGEGDYRYHATGNESACMGSLAYLYKEGQLPVQARLAVQFGMLDVEDLNKLADVIIDVPARDTNKGDTDVE